MFSEGYQRQGYPLLYNKLMARPAWTTWVLVWNKNRAFVLKKNVFFKETTHFQFIILRYDTSTDPFFKVSVDELNSISVIMYTPHFLYPFICWWTSRLIHNFAVVNYVDVQVSLNCVAFNSLCYVSRSVIVKSYGNSILGFFEEPPYWFPYWLN